MSLRIAYRPLEREFFIDNLLVRIHFIIVMIWWTGLAPWKFEFPFPGSLTSTFLRPLDAKLALPTFKIPSHHSTVHFSGAALDFSGINTRLHSRYPLRNQHSTDGAERNGMLLKRTPQSTRGALPGCSFREGSVWVSGR